MPFPAPKIPLPVKICFDIPGLPGYILFYRPEKSTFQKAEERTWRAFGDREHTDWASEYCW